MNIIVSDSSIVASNQWTSLSDKMDQLSLNMTNINTYVADSQKAKKGRSHSSVCEFLLFFFDTMSSF